MCLRPLYDVLLVFLVGFHLEDRGRGITFACGGGGVGGIKFIIVIGSQFVAIDLRMLSDMSISLPVQYDSATASAIVALNSPP